MSKTETLTIRLTSENLETSLLPGDVFVEDREFGAVRSCRLTRDGENNAMIYTTTGERDILGLPCTVIIERVTHETVYPRTTGQKRSC